MSMPWNPYVEQIAAQTGMSQWDVRRQARPACISDEEARRRGYDDAHAYEEALHDFLNGI